MCSLQSSLEQAEERPEQLCSVRALKAYVEATAIFHKSDKLLSGLLM